MNDKAGLTLDELRLALAPAVADAAAFDGWGAAGIESAARAERVDPHVAVLAFPHGAMDAIAAWIETVDFAMAQAHSAESLAALPVRERIRTLVRFRLNAISGHEEALRRALSVMAMPRNAAHSLRLGWHSADAMWRLAGDTATDYNHYTKRAILATVYAATLAVLAGDDSEGKAETLAFLDRRLEGVMRFEKAKAQFLRPADEHFSMARFLGRLRYPAN